jgi:hypothetical protein
MVMGDGEMRCAPMASRFVTALLAGASFAAVVASAGPAALAGDAPDGQSDVSSLRALIEQQRAVLDKQAKAIEAQKRRLDALEAQLRTASAPRVQPAVARSGPDGTAASPAPATDGRTDGRQGDGYRTAQADQPAQRQPMPSTMQENPEKAPEVQALSQAGGVLLNQGQFVIEPSVQYARVDNSTAQVTGFTVLPGIVVGNIEVAEAHRDTVVSAVSLRYGITNRIEAEAKIPYVYRSDATTTRPLGTSATSDVTTVATGNGLGDIEFAGHYQINNGRDGWPFFVGNLRVKTMTGKDPFEVPRDSLGNELELETGNGFWGIEPSVTIIYPSDPAVLFANLNYLWNIERNVGGQFGTIDPGDAIGATLGMGIALNEKLSFSLAYDHKRVDKTFQNGAAITGARVLQLGVLNIGGYYRVNDNFAVNFTIGEGVTRDAPDLQVTLQTPITF